MLFVTVFFLLISLTNNSIFTKEKEASQAKKSLWTQWFRSAEKPVQGTLIKDMNFQELVLMVDYAKNRKDESLLRRLYALMIAKPERPDILEPWRLEAADFLFTLKDYEHSGTLYKEFVDLYPGSPKAEYARYKYIICFFYLSLPAQKDQTRTLSVVDQCDIFLSRSQNKILLQEVTSIKLACRARLFEHEVSILETYLKHKRYRSAQLRLNYLQEHFTDIKNIEQFVVYLQTMLNLCLDKSTRPFIVKIKLQDALVKNEVKKVSTIEDRAKSLSFFMA